MKLDEFTGHTSPPISANIKTAQDVKKHITEFIVTQHPYVITNGQIIEELAKVLGAIGEESLNPNKVVREMRFNDGTIMPQWDILPGKSPFFMIDPITGESVPDPRVIYIGKLAYKLGCDNKNDIEGGFSFMQSLYYATGKYYHSSLRSLDWAWNGIGLWRA